MDTGAVADSQIELRPLIKFSPADFSWLDIEKYFVRAIKLQIYFLESK